MPQYKAAPPAANTAPATVGAVVAAASQLQMLQQQQHQQQQQQLLRPGLMPGMLPGLPMQQLGGVPVSMALPGLVSQPQLLAARPPMLGLPTQPAVLGMGGMGGQVLVGGLPGMPAMVQQVPHLGLIGVPRFR